MHVFIVHAHHEPASFNGAMTREASAALLEAGHEVVVSDLYAMGFDPVSDRRNFTTVANKAYLKQQAEEAVASAQGGFASSLQAEMDKLAADPAGPRFNGVRRTGA
jgi:NAD(P)H dehydrogenase (quinone)